MQYRSRIKLPPFIDAIVASLGRSAEEIVDSLADFTYRILSNIPVFNDLSVNEKKALAYAVVGDLVASPIPSPLDTPLDIVVQDRLRQYLPETEKYRRMVTKIAESIPVLELLPNYVISVLATIREKETK